MTTEDAAHVEPQRTAVIYLRVSTKEQTQCDGDPEGYSIPAQRDACKRKAESLGASVVGEYADRGESARSADRPELQQMLAFVKTNHVDYVIVHKVDRLARNRADDVEITLAIRTSGASLVSCSESIDETPSGMLLHGIVAAVAEFYSRNLANEVIKGSVQKAKSGGTNGKAPLGYLNVRSIDDGREVRTVAIDPTRGPIMKWAFEAYADGSWSVQRLLNEVTRQGLETIPTASRPARPLYLSHFHKLLTHPYYKGTVRYRGVEYPGRHEPLVSSETWQRVQDVLQAHNLAGDRPRVHHCRSRLLVTHDLSKSGRRYPYFLCSGRHSKRTECTFKAVLIGKVEEKVVQLYAHYQLSEEARAGLEGMLTHELGLMRVEAEAERKKLIKRQRRLLDERSKLLQAHYADAIPVDLLKDEQRRIQSALDKIEHRLQSTSLEHDRIDVNLRNALALVTDAQASYQQSADPVRRQLNQALFTRIEVDDDGEVRAELAEPFGILLSDETRALVASPAGHTAETCPEVDWDEWEASWNEEGAHNDVDAFQIDRPSRGRGLSYATLVAPGGIEPPRADSKSAALPLSYGAGRGKA